eukprot:CAMPEP_0180826658 /NCGR_PEP_ID=MMETSP1038_2-20121128/73681_1 /TAXON_ID=632150 /ORGANISM="Azadinium spinosum, Strain 3D9" /LENGTH=85 /DNA_ID=CAMNT_0022869321 /DNA_START=141 /DNA_END=395 /DNA_ORIENTATION=+
MGSPVMGQPTQEMLAKFGCVKWCVFATYDAPSAGSLRTIPSGASTTSSAASSGPSSSTTAGLLPGPARVAAGRDERWGPQLPHAL